ncbi:MAG: hypothetical protein POELPBGB_01749 [Bacteroidia bacterium]|nr:hypothetical protein [Bacteroidia bacterium]
MKKLLTLTTTLLVLFFISGCDDCKDGCCKEVHILVDAYTNSPDITFTEFTGTVSATASSNHVYYYYVPTVPQKVQFFVGFETPNICTKEHLNFDFGAFASNVTQDRSMKIFGEVYWGNDDDELILYSGIPTQNYLYAGQLADVGLKQQFPDGPATLRIFMTVEFETLGTLDLDKAYFLEHIEFINASYYYYEYV